MRIGGQDAVSKKDDWLDYDSDGLDYEDLGQYVEDSAESEAENLDGFDLDDEDQINSAYGEYDEYDESDGSYEEDYGEGFEEGYEEDNGEYTYEEYDDAEEYGDYYEEETYAPKEKPLSHTVIYMLVVLAFSVGAAILMWFAADDVLALTKPNNQVTITIAETDTLSDVAQNLKDHGLVEYKYLFILYGKFSHAEDKLSAGTFDLNQMFDYHALVNGLSASSDARKTVTLTFPEGFSTDQIFAMLAENEVCSLEDLEETAANYEFELSYLQDLPYGSAERLEGFLFPDTYDFYVDDDPVRVINKFLNNFDSKITEEMLGAIDDLNENIRNRMESEGSFTESEIQDAMMDLYKVIILASLIEKEAGTDSERSMISSVIYNRLNTRVHELLQVDATVEYALGEHKTELTASDLAIDSPYNTYKYKGLPPGPIANAGISSIMAAIYPETSDYYFYAVNNTGSHSFFETYMEQQDFINGVTSDPEDDADKESDAPEGDTEQVGGDVEEPYSQQTVTREDGTKETVYAQ